MQSTRVTLLLAITTAVALLSGCDALLGPETNGASSLPAEAQEFVTLMNDHRESLGLNRLEWHSSLASVAQAHSQDMKDRSYFSHDNPDGQDPFQRMTAAGITYSGAAENIARGQSTGQQVFDAWINSSGHKANIEGASYTHHGLGYVADGHYWTHMFARNPSGE